MAIERNFVIIKMQHFADNDDNNNIYAHLYIRTNTHTHRGARQQRFYINTPLLLESIRTSKTYNVIFF